VCSAHLRLHLSSWEDHYPVYRKHPEKRKQKTV
jgi:hypothetical protein